MSATSEALRRLLERLTLQEEALLARVEDAGLIDVPQSRLRIETCEDRMLVMRFLCDVGRGGMDPRVWARMNPAAFERLAEIFPRKESGDAAGEG